MKTYIGKDGLYEVDESGSVIQRVADGFGRLTGAIKKFADPTKIPNPFDRDAVINLLTMVKIYKVGGRC